MQLKFQTEKLSDFIEELKDLLLVHWDEAGESGVELDPNYDRYLLLDRSGGLRCFTVRTWDGQLVGYSMFIVLQSMQVMTRIEAIQELLFIKPEFRNGLGRYFIQRCDECLKSEGVNIVRHTVTIHKDYSKTLEAMGYSKAATLYDKYL